MYKLRAGLDRVPHLGLGVMVTRISGMLGVLAIRPGLHPTELCRRLVVADGVDKHRKPRFVRSTNAGVMARLLERDEVVLAVAQRLAEGDCIFDNTILEIGYLLAIAHL